MNKLELFSILGTILILVLAVIGYNVWSDVRKSELYRECWANTLKLETLQKELGAETVKIVGCYRS